MGTLLLIWWSWCQAQHSTTLLCSNKIHSYVVYCESEQWINEIDELMKRLMLLSPRVDNTPQAAQMMRQGPTAPVYSRTDLGEMKMPEPIIVPTIRQMPLSRPTWTYAGHSVTLKQRCFFSQGYFLWSVKFSFPVHAFTSTAKKNSEMNFCDIRLKVLILHLHVFEYLTGYCHVATSSIHLVMFH